MTIVFNAKVELAAQAKSNMVAEIFILRGIFFFRKKEKNSIEGKKKENQWLSVIVISICYKDFRRLLYAFPSLKGKNVITLIVGIISME